MAEKRTVRRAALALALLAALALLCSTLFLAAETDHRCQEAHCPICCQLRLCQSTLHQLCLCAAAAALAALARRWLLPAVPPCREACARPTLITLKVRLSP